jgi:hypothetical protein
MRVRRNAFSLFILPASSVHKMPLLLSYIFRLSSSESATNIRILRPNFTIPDPILQRF